MATANFKFEHRCVVVTDDDLEDGNVPSIGGTIECSYSFHTDRLDVSDNLRFHDVTITSGYYSGACIDYREREDMVAYYMGAAWHWVQYTQKELFKELAKEFGLTLYRVRKVCSGLMFRPNSESYIQDVFDALEEYLREREVAKVNQCIDDIKHRYGYHDYAVSAQFSNGETIYSRID
jgi:hypothetical protein